jgi:hypothetical protein
MLCYRGDCYCTRLLMKMKMKIQKALEVYMHLLFYKRTARTAARTAYYKAKQSKAMEEALLICIDAGTLMHQN